MANIRSMSNPSDPDFDPTPYILNETNRGITEADVLELLARYGVKLEKISRMGLFERAMTHSSYLVRDPNYKPQKLKKKAYTPNYSDIEPVTDLEDVVPLQDYPYERLEFLGDSVLHYILADYLFHRYPSEDEGFMSRLRTKIENKEKLAELNLAVGLDRYVLISKRMEMYHARAKNLNILEDSFEAFIGALHEETDTDICRIWCVNVIETHVDISKLLRNETNYKDTLLQYYHRMRWKEPTYGIISNSGPDHQKLYTMYVTDGDGRRIASGKGYSKKSGEQEAARKALVYFGLLTATKEDEPEEATDDYDTDDELDESEMADLYASMS